jgi:diguanylate cyclase (GGDEF)-like protein
MISYEDLFDRLKKNEEIAKKFSEIEIRILSVLNFRDLFEVLLDEVQNQFRVPFTWITLIDQSDITRLVQSIADSKVFRTRMRLVDRKTITHLIGKQSKPILINENLDFYRKLFPIEANNSIKSMAVAPISLDGEIIGSLNQADFSKERFQPGIDTSLLEQLATKVSLCMSNVTAHEKLKIMAYHDPLTGLLNRRVMEAILNREFVRAKRYRTPLSLVFVDVDKFKYVNDTCGHDTGDELLKYLAALFLEMSRETDIVARYAGDEFVLILPETDTNKAKTMMNRLQTYLDRRPLETRKKIIQFSISFGVVSTETMKIQSADIMLKMADNALYQMKKEKSREVHSSI